MEENWYLTLASIACGWIYLISWTVSFYPQAILNWQKKSVAGFSIEFAILNVCGFFFYSLYSVGGYIYSHLGTGVVDLNDLLFAVHAYLISSIHLSQVFIYDRGNQTTFAIWVVLLLIVEWIVIFALFMLEGVIGVTWLPNSANTFRMAGYCKALITLLKYCPQVYLNYSRKSTVGWSIFNILCDITGGIFCILQQVVDMFIVGYKTGTWSFFGSSTDAFNVVKFLLGVISIFFDVIFIVQHYILYPEKEDVKPLNDNKANSSA